jgi:hypothetical protein
MKKVLFTMALVMMAGTVGSAYAATSSETIVVVKKDKDKKKKKNKKSCCSAEKQAAAPTGSCATGANGTQSSCCSHKK